MAPTNGELLAAPVRFAQRKARIALKPAQDVTDRRSREPHFISHRLSGAQPFQRLQRLHRLESREVVSCHAVAIGSLKLTNIHVNNNAIKFTCPAKIVTS
jgi:hypothetical protein